MVVSVLSVCNFVYIGEKKNQLSTIVFNFFSFTITRSNNTKKLLITTKTQILIDKFLRSTGGGGIYILLLKVGQNINLRQGQMLTHWV